MNISLSQYVMFSVAACLRRPGVEPNQRQSDKDNVILKVQTFQDLLRSRAGRQKCKAIDLESPLFFLTALSQYVATFQHKSRGLRLPDCSYQRGQKTSAPRCSFNPGVVVDDSRIVESFYSMAHQGRLWSR